MSLIIEEKNLNKFILIGDCVLVKPKNQKNKTQPELYLPPTVQKNEKAHSGYIVKVEPSYPLPAITNDEESWKTTKDNVTGK